MSLTTLSYSEANRIIDLYSGVLMRSETLDTLHKFRYSELKGYTIFDIDNSLKLSNAYQVFNSDLTSEKQKEKLEKFASMADGACMSFFAFFAPDDVAQKLAKLNFKTDSREMFKVEGRDYLETELWKEYGKKETHESFLNYCLTIDKSDKNFWEKIYERLGITWDERDDSDLIYSMILNKDIFFRKPIEQVKTVESGNSSIVDSVIKETFFSKHKRLIANVYTLILFCLGLIFPPLRFGLFMLLSVIGAVQLYFWVKEPITNKINFAYHIVYEVLYIVGIFLKQIGFYILLSIILFWVVQMIYTAIVLPKNDASVL